MLERIALIVSTFPSLPTLLTNEWLDWKKQHDIVNNIDRKGNREHFNSGIVGMALQLNWVIFLLEYARRNDLVMLPFIVGGNYYCDVRLLTILRRFFS